MVAAALPERGTPPSPQATGTGTVVRSPEPQLAMPRTKGIAATAALARQQATAMAVEAYTGPALPIASQTAALAAAGAAPAVPPGSWAVRALALLSQHHEPAEQQARRALELARD